MTRAKRSIPAAVLFCAFAALAPRAHAGVMNVTLWQANNPNSIGDPEEQALPTNPLASGTPLAVFNYAGNLNWYAANSTNNYLDTFVGFAGGSVSNCVGVACSGANALAHTLLSTSGFNLTSLFRIVFTTAGPVSGSITHDDGASIYNAANTTAYFNHSNPVAAHFDNFNLPGAGTYNLWYVEANGSPSVLNVSSNVTERSQVPEPSTLALIAAGLLSLFGVGLMRRRQGA